MSTNGILIPFIANPEKILSKIRIVGDCWEWSGAKYPAGYGFIYCEGRTFRVHRVTYTIFKGDIAEGMLIDHICRNKACCNPDHLREATPRMNALENSLSIVAEQVQRNHCKHGHELVGDNIYKLARSPNARICKTCRDIETRKGNEKKKLERKMKKLFPQEQEK